MKNLAASKPFIAKHQAALLELLPQAELLFDPALCWSYGGDNSKQHALPDAVVLVTNHEDVVKLVNYCQQHQIPLTARGRGTGTTGAVVPINAGIVLSFERMQQFTIDAANRTATVEPGVINKDLQTAAAEHGLCWGPDPSSSAFATIGGNLACNAAGPSSLKFGTTRDNVLGLRAVTGYGQSITAGGQVSKSVVGYDLTRLLVGSEGSLAIITSATLKLQPMLLNSTAWALSFDSVIAAAKAISSLMQQHSDLIKLELLDDKALELIRNHSDCPIPNTAQAMLLIETEGDELKLAPHPELLELNQAADQSQRQQIWRARKELSPILRQWAPKKINEDVVVPVTQLPELLTQLDHISDKYNIDIISFGHAGNGNLHVNMLFDPEEIPAAQADACLQAIFSTVLKLGGSISGEHGIGLIKRKYVAQEVDPASLELMRQIKKVFDPDGILNPGKTL